MRQPVCGNNIAFKRMPKNVRIACTEVGFHLYALMYFSFFAYDAFLCCLAITFF
jgi:hypothetical protein